MLAFLHMNATTGITMILATSPSHSYTDTKATISLLQQVPNTCIGIVGHNIKSQILSLTKKVPTLSNLPLINIEDPPVDEKTSASEICGRYFTQSSIVETPSLEQWKVINMSACKYNIKCSAVAGSGKTTTILLCAAKSPRLRHLLLTFNKRLQLDVAARISSCQLTNVVVKTYHAAAGEAYKTVINTDEILKFHLSEQPTNPQQFDTILIDEAQDMLIEYYIFVKYLLGANPNAKIIVVGDVLQSINAYRGANPAFLTDAPQIYGQVGGMMWKSTSLSISYRLTPATATFVNTHLYKTPVIIGGNNKSKNMLPMYISTTNRQSLIKELHRIARYSVDTFGINNVCVLVPSVRGIMSGSKSPIAEFIKSPPNGIPLYIASDDVKTESTNTRDKLAILSFNSVKGCEWQCVIVQMDETYFEYYNREWAIADQLPNILTVVATRAISQLIILAGGRSTLRTIDYDKLRLTSDVVGKSINRPKVIQPSLRTQYSANVVSLTRHLHPATVMKLHNYMTIINVNDNNHILTGNIPLVDFKYHNSVISEDVSQIYYIMSIVLAEVKLTNTTTFGTGLDSPIIHKTAASARDGARSDPDGFHLTRSEYKSYPAEFWANIRAALLVNIENRTYSQWASLAVMHNAFRFGRHHIARQITNYSWVDSKLLTDMTAFVVDNITNYSTNCNFFVSIPPLTVNNITILGTNTVTTDNKEATHLEFKIGEINEENCITMAATLAMYGGGVGRIISMTSRTSRIVEVQSDNSDSFLNALTDRKIAETHDIHELLQQFTIVCEPREDIFSLMNC